jgi:hypothetical protein
MEGTKRINERVHNVEWSICSFLYTFCVQELKERREEKRLSETERKEMREGMWEIEEGGGGDVVITRLHHLYRDVRYESRKIVDVWGCVVDRWW